jgi:anti-sigma factor RsiW
MCPEFEILSAYFDGEIGLPWAQVIETHCTSCPDCCAKLESLKGLREALRNDPEPDWHDSFERVREKISAGEIRRIHTHVPVWKQRLSIPIPAFALGIVLILGFGIFGFLGQPKANPNSVSVKTTKDASGATEIQITGTSSEEVEALLKSLEDSGSPKEVTVKLPEGSHFDKIGEPQLIRSVDYRGNGQ